MVAQGWNAYLRTRETTTYVSAAEVRFGGKSLTLGDGDSAGVLFLKTVGATTNIVDRLVLAHGDITPAQGGDATKQAVDAGSTSLLGGHITVTSSSARPFMLTGDYSRGLRLLADISGDAGTGLVVGRSAIAQQASERDAGHFAVFLNADNSNYHGRWRVDGYSLEGISAGQHAPNSTTWKVRLEVANRAALGDDPATFVSDSITLRNGGILAVAPSSSRVVFDLGNRGLKLGVNSGGFQHTGTGRVELRGVIDGGSHLYVDAAGGLDFAGEWRSKGNMIVSGCDLHILPEYEWSGSGKIVLEGSATLVYETTTAKGPFELNAWPMDDGVPMPVAVTDAFTNPTNGPNKVAVVKIAQTVREVSAEDFVTTMNGGMGSGPEVAQITISVETDGEGMQTVYLSRPAYVWLTEPYVASESSSAIYYNETTKWSDGATAHSGVDYLLFNAHALRSPSAPNTEFPGRSLTLAGSSSATRSEFAMKGKVNHVADLYAGENTIISFKAYSGTETQTLTGRLHVGGTGGTAICCSSGKTGTPVYPDSSVRQFDVASEIDGDGLISVYPYENRAVHGRLSSLNTNFTGSIRVEGYGTSSDTTLVVSDGRNLGGNPAAFIEKGLYLARNSHLHADADVVIDQANRGLYLETLVHLEVAEGKTLTIDAPVTYNGVWVRKDGEGLLKLTGETKGGADNTRFFVRAGSLEQTCLSAFRELRTLCMYNGTTLVVPYQTEDENGIVMLGSSNGNYESPLVASRGATSVSVRLALPGDAALPRHFRVPIATIRKDCAPTTVSSGEDPVAVSRAEQFSVERLSKGYGVVVRAEDVEIDGVACVRYVADCAFQGFAIIVR